MKRTRTVHPRKPVADLETEWDADKNGTLFPTNLKPCSTVKYYWSHVSSCGCKHTLFKSVDSMTRSDTRNCGFCSNRVGPPCCKSRSLAGHINFKYIADEWDYTKNEGGPEIYYPSTAGDVFWKHISPICGCTHSWKAITGNRLVRQGSQCPICAHHKRWEPCCISGTVASVPRLLESWDIEKNKPLDPAKTWLGSDEKVHWKCSDTCGDQPDCKPPYVQEMKEDLVHITVV